MSRRSSKRSARIHLVLLILAVDGVCLPSGFFGHVLRSVKASAQKKTQSSTNPRSQSRRKPGATPQPTPAQTGVQQLGEPPPVPKLKVRPQPEQEVAPGEVISVDTTEVLLPVTVRDAQGRLISNLTRQDFRVFEDSS